MALKIKVNEGQLEEMAYDRSTIRAEARGQFRVMLKHWVLVRYSVDNDAISDHMRKHWKFELIAALWNVGSMELTKGNKRSAVKSALEEEYYKKMEVQNKSFVPQIETICEYEDIKLDAQEYSDSFKEALPAMIEVMASGKFDSVKAYVENLK